MQESKIFLSSSRYESFGLAGAEAEICRCRVVGLDSFSSRFIYPQLQSDQLVSQIMQVAKAGPAPSISTIATQCAPRAVARQFLAIC